MEIRICSTCKQEKLLTEFYPHNKCHCRICLIAKAVENRRIHKHHKTPKPKTGAKIKACSICKEEKPLTEFYPDEWSKGGYKHRCKSCWKQMQKAWGEKNRKHNTEKSQAWRMAHPERARINNATYYRNHSEHVIALIMAYRARKEEAPGTATEEQIRVRMDFYGRRCWICGKPFQAIDHVIPLSKGGTNWPANLRPICKRCNSRKRDRWPWPPERFPTLCSKIE